MSEQRVFLVVEPMAVIAEDLAECIEECHPDALVLRAGDAAAAVAAVTAWPRVTAAFVHLDPQGFSGSALGLALTERAAQIIYMGSRADMAPEGSLLRLRSPFDSETVQMALESICEPCGSHQAPGAVPRA